MEASELGQQVLWIPNSTISQPTHDSKEDHAISGINTLKQRRLSILSFVLGLLLVCAFLVWTVISYTTTTSQRILSASIPSGIDAKTGQPASWFNGDCGTSAAQAHSRDCIFDIVSHSWLPRACYTVEDAADAELMYANATWHWGLDNLTEVSLDDVRRGEFERVWTGLDWHVVHCGYIWKRLHRAMRDGRRVDSYTADYEHTRHCVRMLERVAAEGRANETGTRVYTKFPICL